VATVRRDVVTPDGVPARVELDWIARRLANPVRQARDATRRRRRDNGDTRALFDGADGLAALSDLPGPLGALFAVAFLLVAVVAIVVFIVWVMPLAVTVALVFFEFAFVVVAAIAVLLWRVVLRRPWRIVVRHGDEVVHEEHVVGYLTARRRVATIAADVSVGRS
jgi:hypothetical protein